MIGICFLLQVPYLYLQNRKQRCLDERILLQALYSAQMNNEGLKSQPPKVQVAPQPEVMAFDQQVQEVEMPELRVVKIEGRKSMPVPVGSAIKEVKEKEEMFEGSEDIKLSMYEENMEPSPVPVDQRKQFGNLKTNEEGPRLRQEQMMSPKKVTNKRQNMHSKQFSNRMSIKGSEDVQDTIGIADKENNNFKNLQTSVTKVEDAQKGAI